MKALLSWSSGKDSAWALAELRRTPGIDVVGLLTTITRDYERVSMHGVRRAVLDAQADAAGLPLWPVEIPSGCTQEQYDAAMTAVIARARDAGIEAVAFGDLFLEDIRRYREERLAPTGVRPLFPLWGRSTDALAREMIDGGLRAHVACVDPRLAPRDIAGRAWEEIVGGLPRDVDPCGERGEFHTVAVAGPMFREAIRLTAGPVVERDGFVFADFALEATPAASR